MQDLGSLHRAGIWENVVLKAALASRGIDVMSTPDNSPPDRSPVRGSVPLPEPIAPLHNGIGPEYSPAAVEANAPGETTAPVKSDGPRERMAKALKHLTHGLPSSLAPFFQGKIISRMRSPSELKGVIAIAKMFYMRRTPDASQRKQIFDIADTVADVMLKHLTATISGKLLLTSSETTPNFLQGGDKLSHYACQSVMLGLATLLLVDGKESDFALARTHLDLLQNALPRAQSIRCCSLLSIVPAASTQLPAFVGSSLPPLTACMTSSWRRGRMRLRESSFTPMVD